MTETPSNQPIENHETCFICGSQEWKTLYQSRDLMLDLDGFFWLYECRGCGLVSIQPKLSPEELEKHYPDDYLAYPIAIDEEKKYLQRKSRQRGLRRRCDFAIRESGKATGTVLDVGCATGIFLKGMQDRGWQAQGLEPSDYAVQYAREHLKLNVTHGILEDDSFEAEQFDLVTLWDVFEHLANPEENLDYVHKFLKPGGVLLLTLPNPRSWDRYIFRDAWNGWDTPRHHYVYNAICLTQLLSKHGFRFKRLKSFTGRHGATAISFDFWLKKNGASDKARQRFSRFFNSIPVRVLTYPFYLFTDAINRSASMTLTYIKE